jgi:hypothetical protein
MAQKDLIQGRGGSTAPLNTNFSNTQDNFDELYASVAVLDAGLVVTTGLVALAAGGQTGATALVAGMNNVITSATAGDSVKLPTAVAGTLVRVKNSGANSIDIFPFLADSVDALAVNLAVTLDPGGVAQFHAISATVWESDVDVSMSLNAPTTAKGALRLLAADNDGDTLTTLTNAPMAQASVISIPDPGAASANVMLTDQPNDGIPVSANSAELNSIHHDAGVVGHTVIDFNTVGTATMTVTINSVAYLEADTADAPNGVWTNGASAADSATSLIAAINGDTRAAVGYTAKADASGDGVVLTADAVGTAGNYTCASDDGSATTSNFLGGLEVTAVLQRADLAHIVTAAEVLAGAVVIPTYFVPRIYHLTAYLTSTGAVIHLSDLVTVGSAPNSIIITADGAVSLAAGDIVHLTAIE